MSFFAALLLAFSLTIGLVPLARSLGSRLGMLAHPGPLDIHEHPIPRSGGIGLALALTATLALGSLWGGPSIPWPILLAVAMIAVVGFMDDLRGLSPSLRLMLQFGVVSALLGLGVGIESTPWDLLNVLATFLVLVASANALNFLDGMNGLAAGVAAIAALFLAILGAIQGLEEVVMLGATLMGACLGFLPYNLWRSTVFLGDSGSLFLGFTLGILAVMLSAEPKAVGWPLAAGTVLGLLVVDLTLAVGRRGGNLFRGDREHIYDLLRRLGHPDGKVIAMMYGAAAAFGAVGLVVAIAPLGLGIVLAMMPFGAFGAAALMLRARLRAAEK